jgi:predicted aspartyl protease
MMFSYWLAAAGAALATTPVVAGPNPLVVDVAPAPIIDAPVIDGQTITDEVPIGTDHGDRMTVDVSVGGRGPYRFLVDTGAERTIISRQLAKRLQLEGGKAAVLHSVIGRNDVQTVFIPHLKISSNTISVIDAPALEAANIGADGMLGIDSLKSQRVLFDFKAKTMSITPANKPMVRMDGETVVVRARSRNGRLIFTQAQIDNQAVTVIVDTGSQVTIGNMALQRSLMRRKLLSVPDPVTIESVTGEKLSARISMLKRLEIGDVHIDDLAVAFADAHIFDQLDLENKPALLLGMNAMRAFDRISIDFAAKKVHFVLPRTSMAPQFRLASAGGI